MATAVRPPSILLPPSSHLGAGNNNPVAARGPQVQVGNAPQRVVSASAVTPQAQGQAKMPGTVAHAVPVQQSAGSSQESLASNTVPPLSPGGSQSSTLADSVKTDHTWDDAETNTSSTAGELTPRSSMMGSPTPKIRFGNCPERPPELRRRNSITLGVLARKSMLHAQGTVPGGARVVNMTDEEWEAYQSKFQKPTQAPVDLGHVVSSGAKKLWGKVRRGSNTSVGSTASSGGRGRSDSASSVPGTGMPISPRVRPVDTAPPIEEHAEEEEERAHLPARMRTPPPGEETPRVGRSPSPPPHRVFDDEEEEEEQEQDDSSEEGEHREDDDHHGFDDADHVHRSRHSNSVAALGFEIGDYKRRMPAFASRGSKTSLRSMLLEEDDDEPAISAVPQAHPAQAAPAQQPAPIMQQVQQPPHIMQQAQQPAPIMQQHQQPAPIMQQHQQPAPIMQQHQQPAPIMQQHQQHQQHQQQQQYQQQPHAL